MRGIAVICVLAACGGDHGLLLDVDPGSTDVASVEVFLPKDTAGNGGLGLPPMGATKPAGIVYEVIDTIAAPRDSSGHVRILLQPGDLAEVPALLVLGYDAQHTPIASAVITDASGTVHLPASKETELKVTLVASSYVAPGAVADPATVRISRWSKTGAGGDLMGPCIAVLGSNGNAFFTSGAGDLDCDGANPDCDDTRYDYRPPASSTPGQACVSTTLDPATMDACRVGTTISCTDNIGTCGPRTSSTGMEPLPICVPKTLCQACTNSDAPTGTSGLNPSCEQTAAMDSDTLRIDCKMVVTQDASTGELLPCVSPQPAPPAVTTVDLSSPDHFGPGWGCTAPLAFFSTYEDTTPGLSTFGVDGTANNPNYIVAVHCQGGAALGMTFGAAQQALFAVSGEKRGLLSFAVHAATGSTAAAAVLTLPFRLSYKTVNACPQLGGFTCQVTANSGNPKDDPIWHCAGR